jgi:TPR repeat protein
MPEFDRGPDDTRGRAMLSLAQVLAQPGAIEADVETVQKADAGEPDAQNDLGMTLMEAGRPTGAVYWLELAANQGNADAMQHLARHYMGSNVPVGVMWLSRSASLGHVIASKQLAAMLRVPI